MIGYTMKMIIVATALLVAMTGSAAYDDTFSRESFALGTATLPYINADGNVNVSDVTALINIILGNK